MRAIETLIRKLAGSQDYYCEPAFAARVGAAVATRPTGGAILHGPAGTGKTYLAEQVADLLCAGKHFQQCFPGTREDDLVLKPIPSDVSVSGITLTPGVILDACNALKASTRMQVLVLDEWDKTRPSADSFLLDFLQEGRLRMNGHSVNLTPAQRARLVVFLTTNDEREVSEPLLRRLPKIDFAPLAPALVRRALERTHPAHPALGAAITLYRRTLAARLPKPATIQELRQLLDAVTLLGKRADWDGLVYQFVTKTGEQHELLRRAEAVELRDERPARPALDVSAYADASEQAVVETAVAAPRMPTLSQLRALPPVVAQGAADLSSSCGIVPLTDAAYDYAARACPAPGADASVLPGVAEVVTMGEGDYLSFSLAQPLSAYPGLANSISQGELLFVAPQATIEDVKILNLRICRLTDREIVARRKGVEVRCVAGQGAEIIVEMGEKNALRDAKIVRYDELVWPPLTRGKPAPSSPRRFRSTGGVRRIALGAGMHAEIVIVDLQQEAAATSDLVQAKAFLRLPGERQGYSTQLESALRFGKRVRLGNEDLDSQWGDSVADSPFRAKSFDAKAATCNMARNEAAQKAHEAVCALIVALRARRGALRAAEATK